MFSRAVFYHLRDVAAQLGASPTAQLRYSESAPALDYAVPRVAQRQMPLERGLWLLLTLAFLALAVWVFSRHDTITLVMVTVISLGGLVQFFRNPPKADVTFGGRVRVTLNASNPVFRFETLQPAAGPPPPIGAELPVAAIRDIYLRLVDPRDKHEPTLGLVEVITEELPPTLFAALPAPAAAELVNVLRSLTNLPAPARSAAAWLRPFGRRYR